MTLPLYHIWMSKDKPLESWIDELKGYVEDEIHKVAQVANHGLPSNADLIKSNKMIKLATLRAEIMCNNRMSDPKTKEELIEECKKIGFLPPESKL